MRRRSALLSAALVLLTSTGLALADSAGYSLDKAKSYANARDWSGLLGYAKGWTQAAPNDPDGWYAMARAYGSKLYNQGLQRPVDAVPAYQRAVALRPQWPEAWYALGMTQQELGHFDDSIGSFRHAVEQAPTRPNYWNSLAASYSHQRKPDQAAKALERLEQVAKTAYDWYLLGNGLYGLGDAFQIAPMFPKAEAAYRRALQLDPKSGHAWTNLGTAEEAQEKYTQALRDYQRGSQLGDADGGKQYARLQGDIAACRTWNQRLIKQSIVQGTDFLAYKQHCTKFGG